MWAAAGADASDDKSVEIMRKFSEQYARRSNTYFCADKTVTAVVIKVSMPSENPVLLHSLLLGTSCCDQTLKTSTQPPMNTKV